MAALMPPLKAESTPEPVFTLAARLLTGLRRFSKEPPKPKPEGAAAAAASGAGGDEAEATAAAAAGGDGEGKKDEDEESAAEARPAPEGRAGILRVFAEIADLATSSSGDAGSVARLTRTLPRAIPLALRTRESEHAASFVTFARTQLLSSDFLDAAAASDPPRADRLLRLIVEVADGLRDQDEIRKMRSAVYAALKAHLPKSPPAAAEFGRTTGAGSDGTKAGVGAEAASGEGEGDEESGSGSSSSASKVELPAGAPHFSRLEVFLYAFHSLCSKDPASLMPTCGLDPKPKTKAVFTGQPSDLMSMMESNPMQEEARTFTA